MPKRNFYLGGCLNILFVELKVPLFDFEKKNDQILIFRSKDGMKKN